MTKWLDAFKSEMLLGKIALKALSEDNCVFVDLIRKPILISKFLTSQPGKQTITIHLLPDTSRSQGNQTVKFSQ